MTAGYIPIQDAADYLRVSRWTVARLIRAGELDGNGTQVSVASLRAFIDRCTVPATTTARSR